MLHALHSNGDFSAGFDSCAKHFLLNGVQTRTVFTGEDFDISPPQKLLFVGK